ncbi:MAG TPA: tannase/feruloyl esterase family alpha/beta hydrolase, partial [Caldimonas sp.]
MNATGSNTAAALALVTALLAACVGAPPPAALAPAQGSTLVACEALAASFTFARTKVTAATTVPVGELSAAGIAIGPHCRVVGAMNDRLSPVDGKRYAIGFEMRLPQAWNGRFFYQANGGLDGVVVPALGGIGGGAPVTNAL